MGGREVTSQRLDESALALASLAGAKISIRTLAIGPASGQERGVPRGD
jgi:hypothetical protein